MRRFIFIGLSGLFFMSPLTADEPLLSSPLQENAPALIPATETVASTHTTFKAPFTGKITASRVRLRTQPNLNSLVIRELSSSDLVQVMGEIDDFYSVLPASSDKGYIFRTYVLDGVVEGNNVNLRFKPDMNAPVISQLQQGDKIGGHPCAENPKWLEVDLPSNVHFYVAKEFVTKEGTLAIYKERMEQKKLFLTQLTEIETKTKLEFQKPFTAIDLSSIKKEVESFIGKTKTLAPELSKRASELLHTMQEEYFQLCFQQKEKTQIDTPTESMIAIAPPVQITQEVPQDKETLASFFLVEQEKGLVQKRLQENEASNQEDLYAKEKKYSIILKGKLIPFERQLKVKPGDYLLIQPGTKVPCAYLYSTKVDLRAYVGKVISIEAAVRPDYNFALPAYFVHEVKSEQ